MISLFLYCLLFNRFAHSAGPGMVGHRVEQIGRGVDCLMRRSESVEWLSGGMDAWTSGRCDASASGRVKTWQREEREESREKREEGQYGVEKGWSPSGGLIWGPRAASWGLSSVFSLLSSLSSLRSSLFCSHCCSFLRSHFAPVPSNFASGHRLRPQLLRPFAAPSLARRNARSD